MREQDFGWKVTGNGRGLKTYKTGPAYPGYVYVPTANLQVPMTLGFKIWPVERNMMIYHVLSWVVVVWAIDYCLFRGLFLGWLTRPAWRKTSGWWEKEDV